MSLSWPLRLCCSGNLATITQKHDENQRLGHAHLYEKEMPPSHLERDALILGDWITRSLLLPYPTSVTIIVVYHHETTGMEAALWYNICTVSVQMIFVSAPYTEHPRGALMHVSTCRAPRKALATEVEIRIPYREELAL